MISVFQYPLDLSKKYNFPIENWSKMAWKQLKDYQAVWITIYNVKTNFPWFAVGFIIGTFGVSYIEKNKPELYQRLLLDPHKSLLTRSKEWLKMQSEGTQFAVKVIAVVIIFTPYYPIEGLIIGLAAGEHALCKGREYQEITEQERLKANLEKEKTAENYYLLAKTLNGLPICFTDGSKMTKQELILEAIKLDGSKGEYFIFLASTMNKDDKVWINETETTYNEVVEKGHTLVNSK